MSLWIVRHGQTEANARGLLLGRADPGLDPEGEVQARKLAEALPTPDLVVSSPLKRTMLTAAAFGQDVKIDERVIELDYGDYDLMPLSEVPNDTWALWRNDLSFAPPNGESMGALFVRVCDALDSLKERAAEEEVVVVSHVSPIKASMCWSLGVAATAMWRTRIDQASVTRIDVTRTETALRRFNDIGHLG